MSTAASMANCFSVPGSGPARNPTPPKVQQAATLSELEAALAANRALAAMLTELLRATRQARLNEVDAIERALGTSPRTAELRKGQG